MIVTYNSFFFLKYVYRSFIFFFFLFSFLFPLSFSYFNDIIDGPSCYFQFSLFLYIYSLSLSLFDVISAHGLHCIIWEGIVTLEGFFK